MSEKLRLGGVPGFGHLTLCCGPVRPLVTPALAPSTVSFRLSCLLSQRPTPTRVAILQGGGVNVPVWHLDISAVRGAAGGRGAVRPSLHASSWLFLGAAGD